MKNTASPAKTDTPPGGIALPLRFTEGEARYLSVIGRRLGWTLEEFLTAFIHNNLPLQNAHRPMPGNATPDAIHFEVTCPALAARLERLAKFNDMESTDEWLLAMIERQMQAHEEQMIFDPKTGDVIGDSREVFKALKF